LFIARTLSLMMTIFPSPLTLGTAAFGLPYGIGNPPEMPSAASVEAMLDQAWNGGIRTFDTAPAYGEAESRLGRWIKQRGIVPHVVTKLPSLAHVPDSAVAQTVEDALRGSINRLGITPATYLAHDAADYLRPAIRDRLHAITARGEVRGVGVSVYTEAEVFATIAAGPPDAVQLPISALDQRMVSGGALAACAAANITVFARSIFLQGVLLMRPDQLPIEFGALKAPLTNFQLFADQANTSRASLAVRYVRDLPGVTSAVIGAYAPDQLAVLIAAATEPALTLEERTATESIANDVPAALLDPRAWRSKRVAAG
jgi:aryl-alcohol dehydrogenase-like predicted oxidoreductase